MSYVDGGPFATFRKLPGTVVVVVVVVVSAGLCFVIMRI